MYSKNRDLPPVVKVERTSAPAKTPDPAPTPVRVANHPNALFTAPPPNRIVAGLFADNKLREKDATMLTKKSSEELSDFFNYLESKFNFKPDTDSVMKVSRLLTSNTSLYVELKFMLYDLHGHKEVDDVKLDLGSFLGYAFSDTAKALGAAQDLIKAKNSSLSNHSLMKIRGTSDTTETEASICETRKTFIKDTLNTFCQQLNNLTPQDMVQHTAI